MRFRKMTYEEYEKWEEWSVSDYAKDLLDAGQAGDIGDAMRKAREDFNETLMKGLDTEDNHILVLENQEGRNVGCIWYETSHKSTAFIEDFLIVPAERRKGYGKQTLQQLGEELAKDGVQKIVLHVFERNVAARNLYEASGFCYVEKDGIREGSMYMEKMLA